MQHERREVSAAAELARPSEQAAGADSIGPAAAAAVPTTGQDAVGCDDGRRPRAWRAPTYLRDYISTANSCLCVDVNRSDMEGDVEVEKETWPCELCARVYTSERGIRPNVRVHHLRDFRRSQLLRYIDDDAEYERILRQERRSQHSKKQYNTKSAVMAGCHSPALERSATE